MANHIATGAVHHITLTVTDVGRAAEFYEEVLGFKKMAEFGPRILVHNGSFLLALAPSSDSGDSFDENRVGIDHVSLSVNSRDELEQAVQTLDEHGISHGDIVDMTDFGISVLMMRDPDNIQIELTAPHS